MNVYINLITQPAINMYMCVYKGHIYSVFLMPKCLKISHSVGAALLKMQVSQIQTLVSSWLFWCILCILPFQYVPRLTKQMLALTHCLVPDDCWQQKFNNENSPFRASATVCICISNNWRIHLWRLNTGYNVQWRRGHCFYVFGSAQPWVFWDEKENISLTLLRSWSNTKDKKLHFYKDKQILWMKLSWIKVILLKNPPTCHLPFTGPSPIHTLCSFICFTQIPSAPSWTCGEIRTEHSCILCWGWYSSCLNGSLGIISRRWGCQCRHPQSTSSHILSVPAQQKLSQSSFSLKACNQPVPYASSLPDSNRQPDLSY